MNSKNNYLRELNILELDGKSLSISLDKNYLRKIRAIIEEQGGFSNVGNTINIDYKKIHQAISINSFPLYLFKKLCKIINKDNIVQGISSYKSYGGKRMIKNPEILIRESKELAEIAGHMLGDGYLTMEKGATSSYVNLSDSLIDGFILLNKIVFGIINYHVYLDKRFNAKEVRIPRIISLILSDFYPELLKKEVPKRIFQLPNNFIRSFIRAFADDESCVTTSAIVYVQKEKQVLEDIRNLHIMVGFKEEWLTSVKIKRNLHVFSIIGKGLIYFHKNIGFKNIEKKRDLIAEVRRKTSVRILTTNDMTKKEITDLLEQPKTTKELSALIGVQQTRIRKHIKYLQKRGYVRIIGHKKYKVPLWSRIKSYKLLTFKRKEAIIKYLANGKQSTLNISRKIGKSKDMILLSLHELKKEDKINYLIKGRTYFWYLK